MSWQSVARKDVQDAARSRAIWVGFAVIAVLAAVFAVLFDRYEEGATFLDFLGGLVGLLGLALPVVALLLGYKSIAHERIDGSIVLLLSFPHSRRDVVLGKVVGRALVLVVPLAVTLAVATVAGVALFGAGDAVLWVPWFVAATALFGLAFLGIAIGLSLVTTVDRRVTLGAFGAYVLLVMLWNTLVTGLVVILYRFESFALASPPEWSYLATLLSPSDAYLRLLRVGLELNVVPRYASAGAPWYVDWSVALVILLAWLIVPIAIGYRRFDRADL